MSKVTGFSEEGQRLWTEKGFSGKQLGIVGSCAWRHEGFIFFVFAWFSPLNR